MITDDSDYVDAHHPSHEELSFEAVLHEIMTTVAHVFAHGEVPDPSPADHSVLPRTRFSLADLIAERMGNIV
jgi:hypothetical protein